MLTLNPEPKSGIDANMMKFKINPTAVKAIPKYKQFLALGGSSCLKIKYATIPPIQLKNIGSKNHALLLGFSGYDMIL